MSLFEEVRVDEVPRTLRGAVARRDSLATRDWVGSRLARRDRAAEIADLTPSELADFAKMLDRQALTTLLTLLPPRDAAHVLDQLDVAAAAGILAALAPDDAVDVLQSAHSERLPEVLAAMEPAAAAKVRALVRWPPDTAGGRMTSAFVAIPPGLRADDAVASLRRVGGEAETISYVYVVGSDGQLHGVLSLRGLVSSHPDTPVGQFMETRLVSVSPLTDQEEAARLLVEHDLLAIPVVQDGRLLGVITADDIADVIEEETTEDFSRLGGSQPLDMPYLQASPTLLWRKRVLWLLALFVAEAYTGTVLRYFESDLKEAVALAFFVPLLIGTGGNVGSQIVTTLVRAMAVGGVRLADVVRVVRKEATTGLLLAAVLAIVAFGRALVLRVGYDVSTVVAVAIAAIVLWASFVGAVLPLLLRTLRVDPAVVSAPLITTLVDGTGLLIYFAIARLIL